MAYSLVITPPGSEPVTVTQLHNELRIPTSFTQEDAQLQAYITSARMALETSMHRQFVQTSAILYLDKWYRHQETWFQDAMMYNGSYDYGNFHGQRNIRIPTSPCQSVNSVQYYDSSNTLQTLATTQYYCNTYLQPGTIHWITTPGLYLNRSPRILINLTVGYSTVPQDICSGILQLAQMLYNNRSSETTDKFMRLSAFQGLINRYRTMELDNYGL